MPTETDLPCPDCGAELTARVVDAGPLPGSVDPKTVTVAECPECGARLYPERTLVQLFADDGESTHGGA